MKLESKELMKIDCKKLLVLKGTKTIIQYISFLQKYIQTKSISGRNKIMKRLCKLETEMIVPQKYMRAE